MSVLHSSIHLVNFLLVPRRLDTDLRYQDCNLSRNIRHEDQAGDVHDDHDDELCILGRLQLVATDHKH